MKRIIILVALALSASCIPPDFPWIVDPVCPAILIECEEGEPVDTNFDGCVDSCGVVCYDDSYCNDNEFCQVSDGRVQAQPAQAATSQNALVALVGICTPQCFQGEPRGCGGDWVDSDGDGCVDTCIPFCPDLPAVECDEGSRWADTDGDGCIDRCVSTCEYAIDCAPGSVPVDINGDGCDDLCEAATCDDVEIECEDDQISIDSDGDGCLDSCESVSTCEAYPVCDEGHLEISSPDECLQDVSCYTRSICGYTILCTG